MVMLQTVGVALAAKASPEAHKIIETARDANGGAGGTATGWGEQATAFPRACAAPQNGTLADLLDWGGHRLTGPPSAGIVPVAWVMAESLKKGRQGSCSRRSSPHTRFTSASRWWSSPA